LGLIGNAVPSKLALRDALSKGFRTEFFIKTGLVLLGASINLKVLVTWFLIFAFVSIGLEFSLRGLREAGWRPVAVFASATVVNIVVALGLATVLFGNFQVG
jgi:uncharacterized membrane protein YadS